MSPIEITTTSADDPLLLHSLRGKVALITGAAGGQGVAHARLLHGLGMIVILTDLVQEPIEAVAAELGDGAVARVHDVARAADWAAVVELARERFGRLDVLVNNAAIYSPARFEELGEVLLRRTLDVNLIGPILGMQAVVPLMKQTGGSIVNICSTAGIRGSANMLHYATSKWGLRGASRSVAVELGRYGIRVNAIMPGAVDTPMADAEARSDTGWVSRLPIPRAGRPEEISRLVAFLSSDASSYCTGQDFVADGGMNA